MNKMKWKIYTPFKKLTLDWTDKKLYFIQYRMSKVYVKHVMIVEKVLDVISNEQSRWLKPYIDFVTNKRAVAKNDFDQSLHKSMNCFSYGKTMKMFEVAWKWNSIIKMMMMFCCQN